MARRTFPGGDSSLVYGLTGGGSAFTATAGTGATIYLDPAGSTLATDLTQPDGTTVISNGRVIIDPTSRCPRFKGPPNDTSVLYIKPDGSSVISPLYADAEEVLAFANATYLSRTDLRSARQVVGGNNRYNQGGLSAAGHTTETSRILFPAFVAGTAPVFILGNIGGVAEAVTNGPVTIVAASVENGVGGVIPLTFGGRTSVTLQPGQVVQTDPVLGMAIAAGTSVAVLTAVSGTRWPTREVGPGGAVQFGVNRTGSAGAVTADASIGFGPIAMIATPSPGAPQIAAAALGDSIVAQGTIIDAFTAANTPWLSLAQSTETSTDLRAAPGRLSIMDACGITHAYNEYGINDLYQGHPVSQIKKDLTAVGLAVKARGIASILTTTTPNSPGGTPGVQEARRVELNTWKRTLPNGFDTLVDFADTAETARNSGLWKAGYTDDFLHPNTTGRNALNATLSPAALPPRAIGLLDQRPVPAAAPASGTVLTGTPAAGNLSSTNQVLNTVTATFSYDTVWIINASELFQNASGTTFIDLGIDITGTTVRDTMQAADGNKAMNVAAAIAVPAFTPTTVNILGRTVGGTGTPSFIANGVFNVLSIAVLPA